MDLKFQIFIFQSVDCDETNVFNGYKISGKHTIEWNAENLPSGIYFVKLNAGEFTQTQKLMLVKQEREPV